MDIGIKNIKAMTLEDILSVKKTYELPLFQRDYSWTKTEWLELVEDAETSFSKNREHFFGFMTFKVSNDSTVSIIEGQQRLSTVTIIISVIRDLLYEAGNSIYEKLDTEFIKSYETFSTSEVKFYRLELSNHNQTFFQKYVQDVNQPKEKIHLLKEEKNLNQAKQLISECYQFYYDYFIKKLSTVESSEHVNYLVNFSKTLLRNFAVVYTEVRDELAAYNIFQTLNNRGLDLNLTDLIKVYLFRNSQLKMKEVVAKWDEIRSNLDQFNASEFFRHYWLSRYDVVKGPELLKVIESKITNDIQVISFLDEIIPESENYNALLFPNKIYWSNEEIIEQLENIHILSKQITLPILLSLKNMFNKESDFLKALKLVINFTFRYLTIGDKEHKTFERVLSKIAVDLRNGEIKHVDQIRPELLKYDVDSDQFKINFIKKRFAKAPLAKYVLKSIEKKYSNGKEKFSRTITLEHILPKNLNPEWSEYLLREEMVHEDYLQLIGNLTLINKKPNGQLQNKFITEKSIIFESSSELKINEDLIGLKSWNSEDIIKRGTKFANIADEIWEI